MKTQDVKRKFQDVLGFRELPLNQITPAFVRHYLQNRANTFMEAVALETTGKDFWLAVDATLERIKASRNK